jgi:hypothetical protein
MGKGRTKSRDMHGVFQRVFLNNGGGECVLCSLSVPYVNYSQILYNFLSRDIINL